MHLLADLRALLSRTRAAPLATSRDPALVALEERWAACAGGQPLTQRQLAALLASYQIRPKQMRQGAVTRKGYPKTDFADALKRYEPPDPILRTGPTSRSPSLMLQADEIIHP